jgi:hypothetical protein
LQELPHRIGNFWRTEKGRNELSGAIRLIAAREATRKHHNLTATNFAGKQRGAFGDCLGWEIVDDQCCDYRSCTFKGCRTVVLTVISWEDRDNDTRMSKHCCGGSAGCMHGRMEGDWFDLLSLCPPGEDRFHFCLPSFFEIIKGYSLITDA